MKLSDSDQAVLESLIDPDGPGEAKYRWDDDYQKNILGMLLVDRYFLVQSVDLVDPSYFVNDAHSVVAKILFSYFKKYKSPPSKSVLIQEIKDKVSDRNEDVELRYLGELDALYEYYVPGLDAKEYLLDKIVNFAKMQGLRKAFNESIQEIKRNPEKEETWTKVYGILRDSMNIDRDFNIGLEYFEDPVSRYEKMGEEQKSVERFTSGFPSIDNEITGGGICRGELGSWMGISGSGKSLALVAGAVENINKGKKVLYVSLEMDEDRIAQRFDAQFTGQPIQDLYENRDIVIASLESHLKDFEWYDESANNNLLVIKQFPAGGADVNTLRAYFSQCVMNGFRPDMIIVDYVGEMKDVAGLPTHESRYRLVRDLRGFATEKSICILTAMQPGRAAREAQQNGGFIDDDMIADSQAQVRPLDCLWSLNQSHQEKKQGVGRVFVVKHRNGKSRYHFYVEYDPQTLKMSEIDSSVYHAKMNEYKEENMDDVKLDKTLAATFNDDGSVSNDALNGLPD